jgi:hypothetical protein
MFGGFSFNSFNTIPGPSAPAPEVNAEIVPYSDPFPADWLRMFNVCSSASVAVPIPGTSDVENFQLINGQSTLLPTAPVTPIISPVQNPKINGNDLFAANTISAAAALTLSWSPPAIGSPYGYVIQIAGLTTLPGPGGSGPPQTEYLMRASLGTAKTSITVPPGIIPPGNSYLISITAVVDGKANMETSPHRSMLPVASANILSAVQTIGSTGQ